MNRSEQIEELERLRIAAAPTAEQKAAMSLRERIRVMEIQGRYWRQMDAIHSQIVFDGLIEMLDARRKQARADLDAYLADLETQTDERNHNDR